MIICLLSPKLCIYESPMNGITRKVYGSSLIPTLLRQKMSISQSTNNILTYQSPTRRGGILLLTMVLIAFLSLLVLLYIDRTEELRKIDRAGEVRAAQQHSMKAGLELSLASLNKWRNSHGSWISPSEEWARPIQYLELESEIDRKEWPYEIIIEDLGSKIPFVVLSEEDISSLFRNLFRDNRDHTTWTDRLLDWMDGDDLRRPEGAEYREYGFSQNDALRLPPNRPIQTKWEWDFFLSNGLPETMASSDRQKIRDLFHFYPVQSVNLNTIDQQVLQKLGEAYQFEVSRILSAREQAERFPNNRSLYIQDPAAYVPAQRLPPGLRFAAEIEGFRVIVRQKETGEPKTSWLVLTREPNDENVAAKYTRHPAGFYIFREY